MSSERATRTDSRAFWCTSKSKEVSLVTTSHSNFPSTTPSGAPVHWSGSLEKAVQPGGITSWVDRGKRPLLLLIISARRALSENLPLCVKPLPQGKTPVLTCQPKDPRLTAGVHFFAFTSRYAASFIGSGLFASICFTNCKKVCIK